MAADSDGKPKSGLSPRQCLGHKLGVLGRSHQHQLTNTCEEDHDLIQTVFTCHGNLEDPDFPERFSHLLEQLSTILCTGKEVLMRRVKKIEPWNSVRVTLTIPREAASRLRSLAAAGDSALQALGILSVQLEGDQVISLRLAARFGGEPQEIVLRTSSSAGETIPVTSSAAPPAGPVAALLNSVAGTSNSSGFKSPNVVAPATTPVIPPSPKPNTGPSPYPFTSMTHAAQTHQSRQDSPHHNFTAPPPYTAKSFPPSSPRPNPSTSTSPAIKLAPTAPDNTVSMSSPLLVNLLQTDGKEPETRPRQPTAPPRVRPRPPPPRLPPPIVTPPQQRFPPALPVTVAPTTVQSSTTSSLLRPTFTTAASKEVIQPRSVMQSYSQFTASTSKPCTSTEIAEKSEEKNSTADGKKLIINPLTGELEPMPSESSESEEEGVKDDPFLYSSSPASRVFSDDDSMMSRRNDTSDQSDSEATSRSNGSEGAVRRRLLGPHKPPHHAPEKIKLRLMLDKSEPGQQVSSTPANAYKVDLSFSPSIRKVISSGNRAAASPISSPATPLATQSPAPSSGSAAEEPRVPPLHISLRGRNATVVSNKKKPPHWLLDEDLYTKLTKKKLKLGSGSTKDGRDIIAINNCDLSQKPKRAKVKRLLGVADGEGLKLKIPVTPDMDMTDLCDEKLSKKRKDSKKVKNNVRHSESDSDGKGLKMDSEEWISRTLKEETLRNIVPLDSEVPASESAVSALTEANAAKDDAAESGRTSVFELSELLRCKKVDNSNKKLDCLKIKNKLLDLQLEEPEPGEIASVKKPQEIGGKIKSELSSKIDRVSGKLKNDLSKDGLGKKKLEDTSGKGIKGGIRPKVVKKDVAAVRLTSLTSSAGPTESDDLTAFNRTKRRHSGDQSAPESQAQKVKRSSSSDQPSPLCKLPAANRRFDALTRKIRKDSVIDRLRKDKLGKVVPLNVKLPPGSDPHNKKVHTNRLVCSASGGKSVEKSPVVVATLSALVEVKPSLMRLEGEAEKLKEGTGGAESSTQGEDSGIESMDALSEKSPNQGESPCRKEDDGKKGQNHDRTDEEEVKDLPDNSCLTMGNSNQETQEPQAHSVPFQCSSENNNSVEPEPETSTKLSEPGDTDLIGSFESKIREAFRRDEGLAAKILEGSSKDWEKDNGAKLESESGPECIVEGESLEAVTDSSNVDCKTDLGKDSLKEVASPSLEDLERFRVNPPLYTYAKREDSLSPSPTTVEGNDQRNRSSLDDEPIDEDSNVHEEKMDSGNQDCELNHVKLEDSGDKNSKPVDGGEDGPTTGRLLRHNKSLLEQLLIEIPPDDARRTRSWNKIGNSPGGTPKSSPRPGSPSVARPSPRTGSKLSPTPRGSKRPSKRKCSENAAELIKACMGLDENKVGKTPGTNVWKRGEVESSDDEPLSDLARSREQSVEHDVKPALLKPKLKQISLDEESRNNNKVAIKVVADTPTRRSVRQTQASAGKIVRNVPDRSVRSTRSALTQESCETVNKRRRTSRDGK